MKEATYTFEGSYISCPSCHAKKFRKVYDNRAKAFIADDCGGCFRASCEYYAKSAREAAERYFSIHPEARDARGARVTDSETGPDLPVTTIPDKYLKWNLAKPPYYANLLLWLQKRFPTETIQHSVELYHVGHRMNGCVEWPMIDQAGDITEIKLQKHDGCGHRTFQYTMHSMLVNEDLIEPSKARQCLFGEHLIRRFPDKPVSIVESEKTAFVFSMIEPRCIWLATGGSNGTGKIKAAAGLLKGRRVTIYPDAGEYGAWSREIKKMRLDCKVSDICEGWPWNTDILDRYLYEKYGDNLPDAQTDQPPATRSSEETFSFPPPPGTSTASKLATARAIISKPPASRGTPGEPPTRQVVEYSRALLFVNTYYRAQKVIEGWEKKRKTPADPDTRPSDVPASPS